jgi:hypothetical protein
LKGSIVNGDDGLGSSSNGGRASEPSLEGGFLSVKGGAAVVPSTLWAGDWELRFSSVSEVLEFSAGRGDVAGVLDVCPWSP